MAEKQTHGLRNANDPRYRFTVYCGVCLGQVTHFSVKGQSTIKRCVACDNPDDLINEFQRRAIERKRAEDGAEVYDSLPPEFQEFYYTEKDKFIAEC